MLITALLSCIEFGAKDAVFTLMLSHFWKDFLRRKEFQMYRSGQTNFLSIHNPSLKVDPFGPITVGKTKGAAQLCYSS